MCRCIAGVVYILKGIIYIHRIRKCKCTLVNTKLHTCIPMGNPDIDYFDLYNTAMGRLKQTRSSVRHSFVEFVETDTQQGPVVQEQVVPSSSLKRRASTLDQKTRNSTPSFGDHSYMQDDDLQTPKRVRVGQKVSTLQQLRNLGNNQHTESK